ncbi:MAG: hypothetical protein J7598_13315 [Mitsuaria chitosanitabida]|uniref:hypothetical protein n=1 Tax=Roseateles chitosanitabidus TaxID=65048 RepID=UPI001B15E4EA|nr:hypothetical protein [Roseateles chitosanitabidus]MBO9687581.1 hypothetical protein [Roseateles chitosanitabidus]
MEADSTFIAEITVEIGGFRESLPIDDKVVICDPGHVDCRDADPAPRMASAGRTLPWRDPAMKHIQVVAITLSVTVVAAAAIAQTQDAPPSSAASRRQSGKVGPPVDAASVTAPAPVVTPPAAPSPASSGAPSHGPVTAPVTEHATPEPPPPVQEAAPAASASKPATRTGRAARMASGKVTEAPEAGGGLPIRPDRN